MKLATTLTFLSLSTIASARSFKGRRLPTGNSGGSPEGKKGYGKKGYSEEPPIEYDECMSGKKGGYVSGKKGYTGGKGGGKGYGDNIVIPDYGDSCVICDKQNKNKPMRMVLTYVADGANSAFQPSGKASCREGSYPSPAQIYVNGDVITLEDGDKFEIFPGGAAETHFQIVPMGQAVFDDDIECYIHTSCSVPIVVGDQIGPFLIEGDEECEPPEEPDCPDCQVCDTGRPEELTLKYHAIGVNSEYQPEGKASCRAGVYPEVTRITVEGKAIYISDGDIFTITPQHGQFSAETDFHFDNAADMDCFIHTSCSVGIVPEDQIGPFEIIGDKDCPPEGKCINAVVGSDPVTGETTITVTLNYENLDESRDWAENCDNRDPACPGFDLTPSASDWIGFYPCGEKDTSLPFTVEPDTWAYTCYEGMCRDDEETFANGTIVFQDSTMPLWGRQGIHRSIAELEAAGGGCYVVLLNKMAGFSPPPYYNLCMGNEFTLPNASG